MFSSLIIYIYKMIFLRKIFFFLFQLAILIKEGESTELLQSNEICFRNVLIKKEECGREWSYECDKNYCTRDKRVCSKFNEIKKVIKLNQM